MKQRRIHLLLLISSFVFLLLVVNACSSAVDQGGIALETPTVAPTSTAGEVASALPAATETTSPTLPSPDASEGEAMAAVIADPEGQSIRIWYRHSDFRQKIFEEIIEEFNSSNPHYITVSGVNFEDFASLFSQTLATHGTNDAPDLVLGYQNDLAAYFQSGVVIDLNRYLEDDALGFSEESEANFFPWLFESDRVDPLDGVQVGLALDRAGDVLYANQEWLEELGFSAPPQSPEEFRQAACAASKQPFSKAKAQKSIGYELSITPSLVASWILAFGGELYDESSQKLVYNSEAAIAAWSFVQQLFNEGCATLVSERFGDQTDFGNGELLFAVSSSASFYFYGKAVEEGANFAWQATTLPHTGEKAVINLSGPSIGIVKSTPERELAAWLFLQHCLDVEMQAKWARATGNFPVRVDALRLMEKYLAEHPPYAAIVPHLLDARSEPALPGYGLIRSALSDAMRAIANGEDVTQTLNQLNAEANKILAEQAF